jgi:hypothetical protein
MGPVAAGVLSASHHLALVVDAFAKGVNISRQSTEACDCSVLPISGNTLYRQRRTLPLLFGPGR